MALLLSRKSNDAINEGQLHKALDYIDEYWASITKSQPNDTDTLIGLPYPYIVPSATAKQHFIFEEQYYWDTYFIALGLDRPEYQKLVEGMLDNLIYMLSRFGLVPNASRFYMSSRSQPPLLTSLIFLVYDRYKKSDSWLEERIEIAKQEYQNVWMGEGHPKWHQVYKGLSRYYDINMLHDLAEAESGWDMTTRFERKCLDFLPIDLNTLLYKYETDFARAAKILKKPKHAEMWLKKARSRAVSINKLMWSERRGFFFDYNYQDKKMNSTWSLAAYFTLWAGLASEEQADSLVKDLPRFEHNGGLSTTTKPLIDMNIFGSVRAQWAYPNGWAPLHLIVVEGHRRYGYEQEAKRIATKWIKNNLNWFIKHKNFMEKYNVINIEKTPTEGMYPNQTGFGWTNAVFVYLVKNYL